MAFPCKEFVLSLTKSELADIIRQSTSKRISEKRITYLADKLTELAKQSYIVRSRKPLQYLKRFITMFKNCSDWPDDAKLS